MTGTADGTAVWRWPRDAGGGDAKLGQELEASEIGDAVYSHPSSRLLELPPSRTSQPGGEREAGVRLLAVSSCLHVAW